MMIKNDIGALVNIDCLCPSSTAISGVDKFYLLGIIDSGSHLVWIETMPDMSSLSAMFAIMQSLLLLDDRYQVKAQKIMTDNGAEFNEEPFERLLSLLSTEHVFTPKPNKIVEDFWETLTDDLLINASFESLEKFIEELQSYLLYYNEFRPHPSLNGATPKDFCKKIFSQEG